MGPGVLRPGDLAQGLLVRTLLRPAVLALAVLILAVLATVALALVMAASTPALADAVRYLAPDYMSEEKDFFQAPPSLVPIGGQSNNLVRLDQTSVFGIYGGWAYATTDGQSLTIGHSAIHAASDTRFSVWKLVGSGAFVGVYVRNPADRVYVEGDIKITNSSVFVSNVDVNSTILTYPGEIVGAEAKFYGRGSVVTNENLVVADRVNALFIYGAKIQYYSVKGEDKEFYVAEASGNRVFVTDSEVARVIAAAYVDDAYRVTSVNNEVTLKG
ncbi:MAG: hypothetical protein LBJ61_10320, partial [Deltaproteobacteria bacterium]|nr:hypothetical protein [Deltaproteobacteria bacterium]